MPDACPNCGAGLDDLTCMNGPEDTKPRTGDLTLCIECGALLQFRESAGLGAIDAPPEGLGEAGKRALLCAQALIRERARGGPVDTAALRDYARGVAMVTMVVRSYLEDFPDAPPHFALGPEGIAIVAPVSVMARAICKDTGARFIVKALHDLAREFEEGREATYMMLLGVLVQEGVPFERVSLADLGIIEQDRRPS